MKVYLAFEFFFFSLFLATNISFNSIECTNKPVGLMKKDIKTFKKCMLFMYMRLKSLPLPSKIFDIILINMIKNRKKIHFQTSYFFNCTIGKNINFLEFVHKHIKNTKRNKNMNKIARKLLVCLYKKNLILLPDSFDPIKLQSIDFVIKITDSINKFNDYVNEYATVNSAKLINRIGFYMRFHYLKGESRDKRIQNAYTHSFFCDIFTHKIFKNLYKFFSDLKEIINKIKNENNRMYTDRKIHCVVSYILLTYNSLIDILFIDKNELFINPFIQKYKIRILLNFLVEQYLFLCITLVDVKMNHDTVKFILLKTFVLFCKINNLFCPFEINKLTFDLCYDQEFLSMIRTKTERYNHDIHQKSCKKFLVLEFVANGLIHLLN